jgi:hypothetical protein
MAALSESTYGQWRRALIVILTLLASGLLVGLTYMTAARFGDVISLYFLAWVLQFLLAPRWTGSARIAGSVGSRQGWSISARWYCSPRS